MKRNADYLALVLLIFVGREAGATPEMIRMGYARCTTCHQSASGGGLLTPYGYGIRGASAWFGTEVADTENPRGAGGFDQAVHARIALFIDENAADGAQVFPMQADYHAAYYSASPWWAELRGGIAPERSLPESDPSFSDRLVLRRAMVHYKPSDRWRLSAGRSQAPAGIRIDDHTAFIRRRNRNDVDHYFTLIQGERFSRRLRLTAFVVAPAGTGRPVNEAWGGGIRAEHHAASKAAWGGFARVLGSELDTRATFAVFGRLGAGEWGAHAEWDVSIMNFKAFEPVVVQHTALISPYYYPLEWLGLSIRGELLSLSDPLAERRLRGVAETRLKALPQLTFIGQYRLESLLSAAGPPGAGEWLAQFFFSL